MFIFVGLTTVIHLLFSNLACGLALDRRAAR